MLSGNIHKKSKRTTKSHNEQQKAFACFGLWDRIGSISKTRKARRATKSNERQMETRTKNQNEQQKATKSIFHSYFHSFTRILDLWKVVDIKGNEKRERARTGNEKQWKAATESYEEQQKATTDIGAGKTKTGKKKSKTSNERHKKSKWKPGFALIFINTHG